MNPFACAECGPNQQWDDPDLTASFNQAARDIVREINTPKAMAERLVQRFHSLLMMPAPLNQLGRLPVAADRPAAARHKWRPTAMTPLGQIERLLPPRLNGSFRFAKAVPGCR